MIFSATTRLSHNKDKHHAQAQSGRKTGKKMIAET
jgi:hypothetical protein